MVMMPAGAASSRAAQKAAMAGILYDKQTSPELGDLLQKLETSEASGDFDPFQRAVIREARRYTVITCFYTAQDKQHQWQCAHKEERFAQLFLTLHGKDAEPLRHVGN